uniref:Uncharacterized protein n=1 Tax=Pseudo-nitzschia australis TaxID=44445 RepID=A0A7S4AT47_9STRA
MHAHCTTIVLRIVQASHLFDLKHRRVLSLLCALSLTNIFVVFYSPRLALLNSSVPPTYEKNPKLASWVVTQRRYEYNNVQKDNTYARTNDMGMLPTRLNDC